jgi:hypothetical protein
LPEGRFSRCNYQCQKRLGRVQLILLYASPSRSNDARLLIGPISQSRLRGDVPIRYIQVERDGLLEIVARGKLPGQGGDLEPDSDWGL